MKKMKYHDNVPILSPITHSPEVMIKEVIREVIKEVPVYPPPQIITKEVIKEVQSPHLIEEINRLTQRLAEKEEIIRQINFEKIELISKLNISEVSKSSLINELTGLKEDKADLRSDKNKLHEEISFLRQSNASNKKIIVQKNLEIDELSSFCQIDTDPNFSNFLLLNNQIEGETITALGDVIQDNSSFNII